MKSRAVRVAFCREMHANLRPQPNRATLDPQQFDLAVRLMNCALQNESANDEHGVAYALLFLANTYCRVIFILVTMTASRMIRPVGR